jgi:hypothetical protein
MCWENSGKENRFWTTVFNLLKGATTLARMTFSITTLSRTEMEGFLNKPEQKQNHTA